jgi:hypothetical protein
MHTGGIATALALAAALAEQKTHPAWAVRGVDPLPDSLFLKVVDVVLKQLPEPPSN